MNVTDERMISVEGKEPPGSESIGLMPMISNDFHTIF